MLCTPKGSLYQRVPPACIITTSLYHLFDRPSRVLTTSGNKKNERMKNQENKYTLLVAPDFSHPMIEKK